jgi:5-methyltetrahydrofolate--homocysteine methyltransferase
MVNHLKAIKETIIEGKHNEIEPLVNQAVSEKVDLDDLIDRAMIAAMDVVGEKFGNGEIFVPEMLVAAHTMKKGLDIIRPLLQGKKQDAHDTVVMCTVKGDLHDIGKNLVSMMLEGAGFNVVDLGVNMDVDDLLRKIEEIRPSVLGLSALLTTTMPEMHNVIKALDEKGYRESVKVMVGGAPVSEAFAEKIGADGYGKDAPEAVKVAKRLAGKN